MENILFLSCWSSWLCFFPYRWILHAYFPWKPGLHSFNSFVHFLPLTTFIDCQLGCGICHCSPSSAVMVPYHIWMKPIVFTLVSPLEFLISCHDCLLQRGSRKVLCTCIIFTFIFMFLFFYSILPTSKFSTIKILKIKSLAQDSFPL